MKNQFIPNKVVFRIFAFMALGFCLVLQAAVPFEDPVLPEDKGNSVTIANDLVGGWEYTAQGAPEGYDKGLLLIIGQDGNYQVQVQTGAGTFIGENVTVKKNTISFSLMIEGGLVTVNLTAKGSKISGKSSSSEGDYIIEGVKSLSPE